jgi:Acetyltransferase (GNAT) domain
VKAIKTNPGAGVTGYAHEDYAQSFSEFGKPRQLPHSHGWVLERAITGSSWRDAMGCYPLFVCPEWGQLRTDLGEIEDLVCLSLVTDPFGEYDEGYLRQCFPDVVIPFKSHFVVDLSRSPDTFVHPHHRRNARKALRELEVAKCVRPLEFLDTWIELYQELIDRHAITGMTAFSKESFAKQLQTPGMLAFRAVLEGKTVGMLLWYAQGDRAYYHLGAYSSAGYDRRASFALFDFSIQYFASHGFAWLNLGAGAGTDGLADSGLTRFKRGWSNEVRTAYFCGRIFDHAKYQEIISTRQTPPTNYFPAYRAGEFG